MVRDEPDAGRRAEEVLDDVMSAPGPPQVRRDRREHGGAAAGWTTTRSPSGPSRSGWTPDSADYDAAAVPPATDDPVPVDVTETEELPAGGRGGRPGGGRGPAGDRRAAGLPADRATRTASRQPGGSMTVSTGYGQSGPAGNHPNATACGIRRPWPGSGGALPLRRHTIPLPGRDGMTLGPGPTPRRPRRNTTATSTRPSSTAARTSFSTALVPFIRDGVAAGAAGHGRRGRATGRSRCGTRSAGTPRDVALRRHGRAGAQPGPDHPRLAALPGPALPGRAAGARHRRADLGRPAGRRAGRGQLHEGAAQRRGRPGHPDVAALPVRHQGAAGAGGRARVPEPSAGRPGRLVRGEPALRRRPVRRRLLRRRAAGADRAGRGPAVRGRGRGRARGGGPAGRDRGPGRGADLGGRARPAGDGGHAWSAPPAPGRCGCGWSRRRWSARCATRARHRRRWPGGAGRRRASRTTAGSGWPTSCATWSRSAPAGPARRSGWSAGVRRRSAAPGSR